MKKIQIDTHFFIFDSIEELEDDVRQLMVQAVLARENAYAPYSQFKVGAAVLLDNGNVVLGSNQENAAFPSGLCAERTAIFSVGTNFPNQKIKALCISGSSIIKDTLEPISPCGACRQSLLQYENKQDEPFSVYFMGKTGRIVMSSSVRNLLPYSFEESNL